MNSRERILTSLQHREPDRVPRDLGGTESSGMTALALANLQRHLKHPGELKIFEPYQYVAYIDRDLRNRFGIDTANLTPEPRSWVKAKHPAGFEVVLPAGWREETGEEGTTVVRGRDGTIVARRPPGGFYFDPVAPPLRNLTSPAELAAHRSTIFGFDFPSFADESPEALQTRVRALHQGGDCVVLNLCCHILAAGQLLRGYENFMMDLLTDEEMVRGLLDLLLEGYRQRIDRLAPRLRGQVDVVLLNDDLGTQQGPMLSRDVYRKFIKPRQKELFRHVKRSFGTPILFHSCGAVREFIPDLIEAGVDALNPVQLSAEGMDLARLKQDFGPSMTFWGGGIDTQTVLNRKRPADVKDAVRRSVDLLAPGGGFVFCQVHNVQPDVPPANVVALYEALDELAGR